MHIKQLSIRGIKNVDADIEMAPVVLVHGPNESGKSGVLNALELAIANQSELGSSGKKIDMMVSGAVASALATTNEGGFCKWQMNHGGKGRIHEGYDLQGGMPVTPNEFWGMTSSDKLSLVAGGKKIDAEEKLEEAKRKLKAANEILKAPRPDMPSEVYTGMPIEEIRTKLKKLNLEIAEHEKASEKRAAMESSRKKMEQEAAAIREDIKNLQRDIRVDEETLPDLREFVKQFEPLVMRYQEAARTEPAIVREARKAKLDVSDMYFRKINELIDAGEWLVETLNKKQNPSEAKRYREFVAKLNAQWKPAKVDAPPPTFEGDRKMWEMAEAHDPEEKLQTVKSLIAQTETSLSFNQLTLKEAKERLKAIGKSQDLNQNIQGQMLSPEVLEAALAERDQLQADLDAAMDWERYDSAQGDYQVRRSKAAIAKAEAESEVEKYTQLRSDQIMEIKEPLETAVNSMLTRAGFLPVQIEVESTPKTATLTIKDSMGIEVQAMATSIRTVYGVCILRAIHELSNAPCPVALAQCAELGPSNLVRLMEALKHVGKGNIVLEHWCRPTEVPEHVLCVDASSIQKQEEELV